MEVNNGGLLLNEYRAIQNRPGLGPMGDMIRMPMNHTLVDPNGPIPDLDPKPEPDPDPEPAPEPGGEPNPAEPPDDESEDDDRVARLAGIHRAMLVDVLRRMVRRVAVHARRAAKSPGSFCDAVESMAAEHRSVFIAEVRSICDALGMNVETLSATFFANIRTSLLEAAEVPGARLIASVEEWDRDTECTLPHKLAEEICNE